MKTLTRLQAATALASGLKGMTGLGTAVQRAGIAMKAFALSNPFTAILVAILAVVSAVALLVDAYQDANSEVAKMEIAIKKLNKISERQQFLLSEEIRLLEAQGAAIGVVAKKKREYILEGVKEIAMTISLAEAKKREAIETQNLEEIVANIFSPALAATRRIKRIKEANQEVKDAKQKLEALKTDLAISFIEENNLIKSNNAEKAKEREDEFAKVEAQRKRIQDLLTMGVEYEQEVLNASIELNTSAREQAEAEYERAAERRMRREQKIADFTLMVQTETFTTISQLAAAFAGKTEAAQRRAFNIQKTAGIAQTTIDTIIGAQKAYASQLIVGDPTSIVRAQIAAGFALAQGIARVAIIAKTQFRSSAPPANTTTGTPNLSAPQSQQNANDLQSTGVNQDNEGNFSGFDRGGRVYVVESDITSKQGTVAKIEDRATF